MYEGGKKFKVSKVDDSLSMGIHFIETIQMHCWPHWKIVIYFFNQTNIAQEMSIWINKLFKTHQQIFPDQ